MTNEIEEIYDEKYYTKRNTKRWLEDGRSFSKVIDDKYNPGSVVDLGCGTGVHLKYFEDKNREIKGIDGSQKAKENAVISQKNFEVYDLRNTYEFDEKYDVAFCIEVLEHLEEEHADTILGTLANASDTLVVTAASPNQPGKHHVNLKPKTYWIEKFNVRGYKYRQDKTREIIDDLDLKITKWILKNLMVFEKRLKWK